MFFATPWIALFLAWLADEAEQTRVLEHGEEPGPIPEPERHTHGHHYLGDCTSMNYELPHWLHEFAVPVSYRTFAEETSIADHRRAGDYWARGLSTSWHPGFYKTTLPSGTKAYFLTHSGFEHLFAPEGVDLGVEKRLAAEAGSVIEQLDESPAQRGLVAIQVARRNLLRDWGESPFLEPNESAFYLEGQISQLQDHTQLQVLGVGASRVAFLLPGGEVMKLPVDPAAYEENARECAVWERARGTPDERWFVPILSCTDGIVYMEQAEPVPPERLAELEEIEARYEREIVPRGFPTSPGGSHQWGIHRGQIKLLDYAEVILVRGIYPR